MTSPIDQAWPEEGLERVEACPYCDSTHRTLAYKDVQDWSFNCAPGKWDYWDCEDCKSLYLDPRPTRETIGSAYATYYTHGDSSPVSLLGTLKNRLRNECLSRELNANISPRLHLPKMFGWAVALISKRVLVPFGWQQLANQVKGRFIDVGCGAGSTVAIARQLGWDAMGMEIDPAAVITARRSGLNVVEGTYEHLSQYEQAFDFVMCSHVLEHVHDPLDLLGKLKSALKPGGVLLLTLPNSLSCVREHFGAYWRGLEAPRHIAIPSEPQLMQLLSSAGFTVQSVADFRMETVVESLRIQRREVSISREDQVIAQQLDICTEAQPIGSDFIKLICRAPMSDSR
jgi:2-polyprenyl-3-methyl-5-hydroxy-6-metoxy-1,4-benzoquinol methylase